MITDSKTNTLYVADCLPIKYSKFYTEFELALTKNGIIPKQIANTKDVWAVDYMPIQITKDRFVKFVYSPDYLKSKMWAKSISDVGEFCKNKITELIISDIVLHGRNIIKCNDKIIMCDKVFSENPSYTRTKLIHKLRELFEVDKLFFIPQHPKDFTGHADGMVRFLDENTVLINNNSKEKEEFQRALKIAIHNAGLEYIEIPYNPYNNKKISQANGVYMNYLEMSNLIFLPTYNMKEDDVVVKLFEKLFNSHLIIPLCSNDIADNGGVLNCITWNILE